MAIAVKITNSLQQVELRWLEEGSTPAEGAGCQQELWREKVRRVEAAAIVLRGTAVRVDALSQVQLGTQCSMCNSSQVVLH